MIRLTRSQLLQSIEAAPAEDQSLADREVNLGHMGLLGANLRLGNLHGVNFGWAKLTNIDLFRANLGQAFFYVGRI